MLTAETLSSPATSLPVILITVTRTWNNEPANCGVIVTLLMATGSRAHNSIRPMIPFQLVWVASEF